MSYGGCLCGKNLPHVQIWNKPSYGTNIWPTRSSKTLNRWPRFRLQLLAQAWACSSNYGTSHRPDRQTRYGTRSYLNKQKQSQEREWNKYEDVHVHITFVARVVAKKAVTHPSTENTWALGETLLKAIRVPTPVTKFEQVRHRLLWTHNIAHLLAQDIQSRIGRIIIHMLCSHTTEHR